MTRNFRNKYIKFDLPRRCSSVHVKHHKFLKIAAKEAEKSSMYSQHGCVIVYKGNVVAVGHNKKVPHFGLRSIHAEIDALTKISNKRNKKMLRRCVMYVVRVGGPSIIKNSRPCNNCTKVIKKANLKTIHWSTDEYDNEYKSHNCPSDSDTSCDDE